MPVHKVTPAQAIKALQSTKGTVYAAAKRLGISAVTLYQLIKEDATVKQALHDARGQLLDVAEQKLHTAVNRGSAWAICFLLKTKAKHRGYVERQEVTGKGGKELIVKVLGSANSMSDL